MSFQRLTGITAQVVSRSLSGGVSKVSGSSAQAVVKTTARVVKVSDLVPQAVTSVAVRYTRVAQAVIQVLVHSMSGGEVAVGSAFAEVVFSVGIPATPRQHAWTFDFDGHTFYVLDLGDRGAMVYDLTTRSWSVWDTLGYQGHLNMKNGFHWRDGKMVVGGGILNGLLVQMNEGSYLDEDFRPVAYEVSGVVFASTERYIRQVSLRLVGSPGRTGLVDVVNPPVLNMTYSDDNGATWAPTQAVTLSSDSSQRIEFRSLGAFRQPGRIFKLFDNGGVKFIAYVMADVEGEKQ